MDETMNTLFLEGLIENDRNKLLCVPKSDLHNHSSKGCRRVWLEKKLNRMLPKPPKEFGGLIGMQEWFTESIKPFCKGADGIIMRWEGAFIEAKRNNITRLSMSFGTQDIELVGGMENFTKIITGFHKKYCENTLFEPELTYGSFGNPEEEAEQMNQYVSAGFFHSIDVCGGENVRSFHEFIPLYRKAEQYHLVKRIHVGESGTAEEVRKAVELLGLHEVHHGIHAASSKSVMRFLSDNKIQLNVCPSSNVMLGFAFAYRDHPIKVLYENGINVAINTDDLLLFDSSIENEYLLLYQAGTLNEKQLDSIRRNGLVTRRATHPLR